MHFMTQMQAPLLAISSISLILLLSKTLAKLETEPTISRSFNSELLIFIAILSVQRKIITM